MKESDLMLKNYHSHTARCGHAWGTDDEFIQSAIDNGYGVLGFSEHSPWPFADGYQEIDTRQRIRIEELDGYIADMRRLQEKYAGRIEIRIGLECEYFPRYFDWLKTVKPKLDYLILGVHCADHDEHLSHYYARSTKAEQVEEYEGFFSMEMCNYSSYVRSGIEYNAQLYENLLRKGKRLFCHSADDNHNAVPLDSTKCDSFGGFTMILSPELSYNAIFRALETGNFYSSMGPRIHELYIDGNHVHIETDPVRHIAMHYGGKFPKCARGTRDLPVCSADFTITPGTPFIRLTATDFDGRSADTRGVFMDEII